MPNPSNLLLASLSANDAAALQPHLKAVHLEHEKILFEAGEKVAAIYFPTGAVISLVVGLSSGEVIEAAMVGKDGVVGAAAAIAGNIPSNRGIVQLAGTAMTCDVDALKNAAMQSHSLLSALVRHEQTVYAQASQSAACIGCSSRGGAALPLAAPGQRFGRHRYARIHPGISRRDAGGKANQRHTARAHPSTGWADPILKRKNSDHRCGGHAGNGLRMLRDRQIVLPSVAPSYAQLNL
jgi:hypothetical protein